MMTSYEYQKPHLTNSLDDFIQCKSDTIMCHANTSFIEEHEEGFKQCIHNVVSDYIDELRSEEYSVTVELTDEQLSKYIYKPKLLCFDIYNNTELYFIILLINDMSSTKQFKRKKLLLPTQESMKDLVNKIINANRDAIEAYNRKQKNEF